MSEGTQEKGIPGPRELGERKAEAAAQKQFAKEHQACSRSGVHIKCYNAIRLYKMLDRQCQEWVSLLIVQTLYQ